MPLVFLKDTFTGAAGTLLAGRTPDVGGAWSQNFSSPTGGDMELDGSGNLCTDATVANQSIWDSNPAQSTSGDIDITFGCVLRGGAADDFGVGVMPASGFEGYYLSFDAGNTPTLYDTASNTKLWTGSALATGAHSVKLSYRAAGTFAVIVDGVTLTTQTVPLTTCKIVSIRNFAPSAPLGPGVGTSISDLVATDPSTSAPSTTFAPDDAGFTYSPATWSVSHSAAITNSPDGYAATVVNVPAGGQGGVTLLLDTSSYAAMPGNDTSLRWSIDGAAWQVADVAQGTTSVSLANGLAAGAHSVRFYQGWMNWAGDSWGSGSGPPDALKWTGLQCDAGATLTAPPTRAGGDLVVFSDSVAGGIRLNADADDYQNSDGGSSWVAYLARGLDMEVANLGYSSQGFTAAGGMHVPALFVPGSDATSAWDKLWAGTSRTIPAGATIIVQHGNNDASATDATVTAAVTPFLSALRAAAPTSRIVVMACLSRAKASAILAGFNAYVGSTTTLAGTPAAWTLLKGVGDANCYWVDFGTDGTAIIPGTGAATEYTTGPHLNPRGSGAAAALAARALQLIADGGSGGGGGMSLADLKAELDARDLTKTTADRLDAAVSSRAVAGDAMTLTTGERAAVASAWDAGIPTLATLDGVTTPSRLQLLLGAFLDLVGKRNKATNGDLQVLLPNGTTVGATIPAKEVDDPLATDVSTGYTGTQAGALVDAIKVNLDALQALANARLDAAVSTRQAAGSAVTLPSPMPDSPGVTLLVANESGLSVRATVGGTPSASSLQLTAAAGYTLSSTVDAYKGSVAKVVTSSVAGLISTWGIVTAYDPTTRTVTLGNPALPAAPAAGDMIEII